MSRKRLVDPDVERWHKNFPTFPGIAKCVEILHRGHPRGGYLETIHYEIRLHAAEHLDELIAAIRDDDSPVGTSLLYELADATLPAAEEFLIENLQSSDESRRHWAIMGLKNLNTKSARQALWQARSSTLDTPEATAEFRSRIDDAMGWDTAS